MSDTYARFLIKDYTHWAIYISENQNYLGRCVVWCKRKGALDLTDATSEEQVELFVVLDDLKKALAEAFQPDLLNYAFLGNETRHLHCHVIPRYAKDKKFVGVIFEDKLWGHNYKTDKNFKVSDRVFSAIQQKIKESI